MNIQIPKDLSIAKQLHKETESKGADDYYESDSYVGYDVVVIELTISTEESCNQIGLQI